MENNLLRTVKFRILEELRGSVQNNVQFRDKVDVYHKFAYKERPMMGVVLKNASASRVKLSADDYAGQLKSHIALAREKYKKGTLLDWVWEDQNNITRYIKEEDLSSQIDGTNRFFKVSQTPIVSGAANTKNADNFRQIELRLNGKITSAERVSGASGSVVLSVTPALGSTLTVSYYVKNLAKPGRYYIGALNSSRYIIDPLYDVKDEVLIEKTTRTELTASLKHSDIATNFVRLYYQKNLKAPRYYLELGIDYTINSDGDITFLYPPPFIDGNNNPEYVIRPFPEDFMLLASYRWIGVPIGPRDIPNDFHYDNEALDGITLCFSNQVELNDRQVVIVYDQREVAARVYSGHYNMTFEIEVFARDPIQLPDLTDHLIEDMWSRRRSRLASQGLTLEELDPTGEMEEVYDESTGDLYYKNSISLSIMTEWKKFVPFPTELSDYAIDVHEYGKDSSNYIMLKGRGETLYLNLLPCKKEFEVKYPMVGYPRYF